MAKKSATKSKKKTTKKTTRKPAKKTVKKGPAKKTGKKVAAKKKTAKRAATKVAKKAPSRSKVPRISKKEMHDTFFQWKLDGYKVDNLEEKIDTREGPRMFVDYSERIKTLKVIEKDISTLQPKGFEQEIGVITSKLKDPRYADAMEKAYKDLRTRMKEKMFISMVHEGFKVIKKEEPAPAKKEEKKEKPKTTSDELDTGACYLLEEEKPKRSYEIFQDLVGKGKKGVCVTREFPDKLRKKYDLGDSTIFWLSNTEAEHSFKPVELGKLYYNLEEFLKAGKDRVIMLSGLEYLITQNNYSSVLKLIQLLNEQIAVHDAILIVPISPSTLEERDLKLMERELTVIT